MGLIRRKKAFDWDPAGHQHNDPALHERALRFVDTRGVVVREAEAELRAALAAVRAQTTPERERRVAEATRALEEARQSLRSRSSAGTQDASPEGA